MSGALLRVGRLSEGFGREFAFAADGEFWAAATAGELSLWKGDALGANVGLPGYERGAPSFARDGRSLRVGRSVVRVPEATADLITAAPDLLVAGIDAPAAEYPERFRAASVAWAPDWSRAAVVTRYGPPRGIGDAEVPGGGTQGRVLLVDAEWQKVLAVLEHDVGLLGDPVLATSSDAVIVGGDGLRVYAAADGTLLAELDAQSRWQAVAVGPGAACVAAAEFGGSVGTWGAKDWKPITRFTPEGGAGRVSVAVHPSKAVLATADHSGRVRLFTVEGKPIASAEVDGEVQGLGFSPDGRVVVATAPPAQHLEVFDTGA